MGLAVVYGIVKNHEGDIRVESTPGEGSAFSVFLPLSKADEEPVREKRSRPPGGEERILLADDDPSVLEMTAMVLQSLGYKVTPVPGGREAWEICRASPDAFDLVITHKIMPDVTGLDIAGKIFTLRREMPVIIVTGYSETVSPDIAQAAGIRDFVMNPVTKREVAEAVRRALDGGGRAQGAEGRAG
jgi:CheY-like chemotaxis protein